MSVWDDYHARSLVSGSDKRTASFRRLSHLLADRQKDSLSFFHVMIDSAEQDAVIINTDNLDEKVIYSAPGQDIPNGSYVEWMGTFWLVTSRDDANELYTKARMKQCNHLLKWIDTEHQIHEQWCIIEDGTKYLIGEFEDRDFIVSRGDSRLSMTIGKNSMTTQFRRDMRFLIDDPESEFKLAYSLSKPMKPGHIYNGRGVYKFVLHEVATTKYDNVDDGIADYYRHFPVDSSEDHSLDNKIDPDNTLTEDGKKVWL